MADGNIAGRGDRAPEGAIHVRARPLVVPHLLVVSGLGDQDAAIVLNHHDNAVGGVVVPLGVIADRVIPAEGGGSRAIEGAVHPGGGAPVIVHEGAEVPGADHGDHVGRLPRGRLDILGGVQAAVSRTGVVRRNSDVPQHPVDGLNSAATKKWESSKQPGKHRKKKGKKGKTYPGRRVFWRAP